jgi:hypothetical protein
MKKKIEPIPIKDLHPGDVLLSMGKEKVSKMIKQMDGGNFSHASFFDGKGLIHATEAGVLRTDIKILKEHALYSHVFRLKKNDRFLGDSKLPYEPVIDSARRIADHGQEFAYSHLALLGFLSIARRFKVPLLQRKTLRIMLDQATQFLLNLFEMKKKPVICSEIVYRCFSEALPINQYSLTISDMTRQLLAGFIQTQGTGLKIIPPPKGKTNQTGTSEEEVIRIIPPPKGKTGQTEPTEKGVQRIIPPPKGKTGQTGFTEGEMLRIIPPPKGKTDTSAFQSDANSQINSPRLLGKSPHGSGIIPHLTPKRPQAWIDNDSLNSMSSADSTPIDHELERSCQNFFNVWLQIEGNPQLIEGFRFLSESRPVPAFVTPRDLEESPDLLKIGELIF